KNMIIVIPLVFFSSRRRHTRSKRDWSSDVCSSDLNYGWSYGSDDVLVTHLGENSYNWQIDFYDNTGDYMATAVGRYYAINEDVSQLDILNIVYTNNGTNQAVDKAEEDYAKYAN